MYPEYLPLASTSVLLPLVAVISIICLCIRIFRLFRKFGGLVKNCRYCDDKLPILKRVRGAQFCSPFHQIVFEASLREARGNPSKTMERARTIDLFPADFGDPGRDGNPLAAPPADSVLSYQPSSYTNSYQGSSYQGKMTFEWTPAPSVAGGTARRAPAELADSTDRPGDLQPVHLKLVLKLPRWVLWPIRVRVRVVDGTNAVPRWLRTRMGYVRVRTPAGLIETEADALAEANTAAVEDKSRAAGA
jgi:hypothetical protein